MFFGSHQLCRFLVPLDHGFDDEEEEVVVEEEDVDEEVLLLISSLTLSYFFLEPSY